MKLTKATKSFNVPISFFFIVLLLLPASLFSQQQMQADKEGSLVQWITIEEALQKTKTQPRPIILDFYTDWCGWCKRMMQTTYANPGLAQYINTNFYPVKFNAESKDTIEYLGEKYGPSSSAPKAAHNLAIKLLQGKMVYPTTLFINNYDKQKNEFAFNMIASGYLDIKKIEPILIYQLENVFRNSGFEDFEAQHQKAFYDSSTAEQIKELKWVKPAEFFKNQVAAKKKTLVLIHTDWCNACRVMYRTSFLEEDSARFIKDKFELVDFNPEMQDQLTFKGKSFSNPRSPQMPFHELAATLCRNNITLPSLVVLDEKMDILDVIPSYLNPKVLKDIAAYYGNDIYKTKSWADFIQSNQQQSLQK
ncbi:MAG: thioredoxin family protein [Bacteroidota bacterium]